MPNITFTNNSISGRDYRAKGLHIEIPGYSRVTKYVSDDIADKVLSDLRRTNPAIQVSIDPVDPVDLLVAEDSQPEELDTIEVEKPAKIGRKGKKRKPFKRQKTPYVLENLSDASGVTVQEGIEG